MLTGNNFNQSMFLLEITRSAFKRLLNGNADKSTTGGGVGTCGLQHVSTEINSVEISIYRNSLGNANLFW